MMYLNTRRSEMYDPVLMAFVRLMHLVAIAGFIYSGFVLLNEATTSESLPIAIYALWFGAGMICTTAMLRGDVWGAYMLIINVVSLSVYEIVRQTATLGGALLALLVLLVAGIYIRSAVSTPSPTTE